MLIHDSLWTKPRPNRPELAPVYFVLRKAGMGNGLPVTAREPWIPPPLQPKSK